MGLTAHASAQPATLGAEFQVNTYTTNGQTRPDVSIGPGGEFVVAWRSDGSSGGDSSDSIQGRRYASDGTALGSDFQVNTYTTSAQSLPRVSIGPGGEFEVVWESFGSNDSDDSYWSIQSRRFGPEFPITNDWQINTYTTNYQTHPSVSVGPSGEFVVVWQSDGSNGGDSFDHSIQGRRYASNGTALGVDFQVNTFVTDEQRYPGVSIGPGGEFVVVWESRGSSGDDSFYDSIQGRRYSSNGTALGNDFQVNSYTSYGQRSAAVSIGPGGEFVVVWESNGSSDDDSSSYSIQGRRYASAGTALSSDFQVNTYTTSGQRRPRVSIGPTGDLVVVWASFGSSGNDTSSNSVQGRRYASDGTALGSDFQVNTYTTSYQERSGVSVGPDGDFVVVWQSFGSSGSDKSWSSIQGQRFAALFSDGFETGDTSAWSVTMP